MDISFPQDKKQLRTHFLALRTAIAKDDAAKAAQAVSRHALALLDASHRRIAAYVPVRGEIDTLSLCAQLHERGHMLCLPHITGAGKQLVFRQWDIDMPLETGRYDIAEPPESQPLLMPDVVLLPLVAFDSQGVRLGYGGGYYDATLDAWRSAGRKPLCVGLAYACQQAQALPRDTHDQRLDAVITEEGIMRFS